MSSEETSIKHENLLEEQKEAIQKEEDVERITLKGIEEKKQVEKGKHKSHQQVGEKNSMELAKKLEIPKFREELEQIKYLEKQKIIEESNSLTPTNSTDLAEGLKSHRYVAIPFFFLETGLEVAVNPFNKSLIKDYSEALSTLRCRHFVILAQTFLDLLANIKETNE